MRRLAVLIAACAIAVGMAGCVPPNPAPTGLYLGKQAEIHPVVTPKDHPVTWGAAPNIDVHYGGVLYQGTAKQMQDPRPALLPGGREPLRLWVADPSNGLTNRPAIIWLHGGGFAVGIDSMYGLANGTGKEYAQRGYVSISVEYRTDTTVIGDVASNKSLCQWVQDNPDPNSQLWLDRRAQCERNIVAAQHDALASVRWIRSHAAQLGVDPNKIAVGGFSAGAITASNLAYQHEQVGTVSYFRGDSLSPDDSRVEAAIGASGCTYTEDGSAPTTIGPGDAPISFIHSELDPAVPYGCIATTVNTARARGLVAELHSYCGERGHANDLYNQHKAATDEQWSTFLARELNLYTGMRPPSADPTCAPRR